MTITDFIRKHGITATCKRTTPDAERDKEWPGASHWLVTLQRDGRTMQVPFSQGSAHKESPTAEDVLDCLASDAAGVENAASFEDWASEYGYDADSRKAEKTYKTCKKQTGELRQLLGEEAYKELLWEAERL